MTGGDTSGALGIIGVGGLAGFVVEGLRRAGDTRPIILSPRNPQKAEDLARRFNCAVAADNQGVVDAADIVIVATRPPDTLAAIEGLRWTSRHLLINVAAGVTLASIGGRGGAARMVRAMPIASSAIGAGVTALHPPDPRAERLFAALGRVIPLAEERQFIAATAISCSHLWLYGLMGAMVQAGRAGGLSNDAAVELVAGYAEAAAAVVLAGDRATPVRAPLDAHRKPGSLTAAGLATLEAARAFEAWEAAIAAVMTSAAGH